MSSPYTAGPYYGGYYPPYSYPTYGSAARGGGYSPNALPDFLSPTGDTVDSNIAWYNATIAPILDGAQRTYSIVSGNAVTSLPPSGQVPPGYPGGYPPPPGQPVPGEASLPSDGKSGGNGMLLDVGGFALAGGGIGFLVGGPPGAAIGAGIGAIVGGIKNFFFG